MNERGREMQGYVQSTDDPIGVVRDYDLDERGYVIAVDTSTFDEPDAVVAPQLLLQ